MNPERILRGKRVQPWVVRRVRVGKECVAAQHQAESARRHRCLRTIHRQRIVPGVFQAVGVQLDFSGLGDEAVLRIQRGTVLRELGRRVNAVFLQVFERQILALGRPGDTLLAISTSGQSENVIRAVRSAAELRIGTIGLLGASGGRLSSLVDVAILVPSDDVQRIQEAHLTIEHILCDLVERMIHSEEDRVQM